MNTPNMITLTRILMIPIIVFFYLADFIPYARLVATILFILACLTDFLDGYLARKNNQVTTLGKFFDSIADKMLIMTGLVLIIAVPVTGNVPVVYPCWLGVICAILILAREFIVSALRQIAASRGKVLAADMGGKIKATAQFVIVTIYMAFAFVETDLVDVTSSTPTAIAVLRFAFMILLIATTILTVYTGASYLIKNRHVFKESAESDNFSAKENAKQETQAIAVENSTEDENENKSE